ncbi:hypothetical protein LOTGIDRAFT_175777 [Lottia gigantea]|uniref:SET domain-containing protein n=1 Tax=Lottia gigantea TaxID=225164 RepID=V4BQ10_LOTGI|nr:hypothetical protein LOTGIDRAFT_175777 [Lottia gigantea]ESO90939.1 hypothetical protein LOTGIDRAFT_175777 [Lottia gigantea]
MFPVVHDREIPKQHTVFASFTDLSEFKHLGGVDDKGVLAPEGKIIIKTVTSYLRDLKLHRYAQHFVECTRHSKTSTKAQLVKILPKQYPELKNLTAKIQAIASFIFTLNKNFDQPSRSSNVLTMTSDPARLRNAVTSNVWLDLFKKGSLPNRGNGVFAMQRHTKGQVVIDNGGHYLSGKEGDAKYYAGSDGGMGYMIKFRFGDKWHYRDASTDDGHMGRLINHSACCPNVKGNPIDIFGDGKPVIVYTATKRLVTGQLRRYR